MRTLVYGLLKVMLALVYFGGVAMTWAIFRALTGQEQLPQLAIVVSTLVIAALFNPLRRRIQSFVEIGASTEGSTMLPRPSKPSPPSCVMRPTWTGSAMS
jgi:hypothetical protein